MSRDIFVGLAAAGILFLVPLEARGSCASPANPIEQENCLSGTPPGTWDLPSGTPAGDSTIQGFATNISVNQGSPISFKINTNATAYRLDIYRMGYYQGNGARLVTTVMPSVSLPQTQPACQNDTVTGLIDCGNWAVSATWNLPATATSGIYFAKVIRSDNGGASHIVFVVRNDASHSDLLFQTADTTWQAYNDYGGNSLYTGQPAGRAYKVSYNRPFRTRAVQSQSWVFNAEYPMVRWLEANGLDVTYSTGVDTDRNGALITNHKVWMSNGHDEYWSGAQRANVESARSAGVHLAFFSGNTTFWKTRWENDSSGAPYRTLVCYKETHANAVIDPLDPPTWTGTWRDPRFSPPADGGRPENALKGGIFRVNGPFLSNITVPQADGRMRFWRNSQVAALPAGQTATLASGSLGYEVDVDEDNGFRPPGVFHLSTTAISNAQILVDYGSTYSAGSAVHNVTLYRDSARRALVFATGVYNWAWGLDLNHDNRTSDTAPDLNMQQASVNIFADMGVQPATLQAGLVPASASTDTIPPTSVIRSPAPGSTFATGSTVTISGTASDTGGVVGGVEVSTDGGTTWHPAVGRESWSFTWNPSVPGSINLRSRAVDDSGNVETPSSGITVNITSSSCVAGCTIWNSTQAPARVDAGADSPVELGVKFRSDVRGTITAVRFYKASANTGTHIGHLWSSAGTLLASATFTNETASGWQEVTFSTPVQITANTTYVASYHTNGGHYSADLSYFSSGGVDNPPLHALGNSVSPNGVYAYGSSSNFPSSSYNSSNYWVDVRFNGTGTVTSIAVAPTNPTIPTSSTQQFTATATYSDGSTGDITSSATWASSNTTVAAINPQGLATGSSPGTSTISAALGGVSGSTVLTVQATPVAVTTRSLPDATLSAPYSATLAATGGTPPYSWSIVAGGGTLPPGLSLSTGGTISGTPTNRGSFGFTVRVADAGGQSATQPLSINVLAQPFSIWSPAAVPAAVDHGADSAVELGVKFTSDTNGTISGIRFYKASTNTGAHVGNLWTGTGTLLASANFASETASGWQQVFFSSPVPITGNTTYVASYHTNVGHYSEDQNYFANAGVDNAPLHALASSVSPNGVYAYGSTSAFPTSSYLSSNYWVDVLFSPSAVSSVTVTPANVTITAGTTRQYTATATYSDGRTSDITGVAAWTSSNTSVATISAGGLATAAQAGSTTISAAYGGVSGSTPLTVQAAPLAITTTSLPNATRNVAYSVTLAASGGTTPYSWSLFSGALPPGLSLSSGGLISGTPTTAGSFGFTVRVSDASGSSTTRALNIAVSSSLLSVWAGTAVPANIDHGADSTVELGMAFQSDVNGTVVGVRFYKASANTGTHVGNLWSSTGTLLASATFTGETASGWQQVNFSTPVSITANTIYVVSYHTDVGHYSEDQNYFANSGVDSPPLHALSANVTPNGVYAYGSPSGFPTGSYLSSNYWVDVVFSAGP